MEIFIKVSGKKTKLMVKEFTDTWMVPFTKGNGVKINNMARAKNHGLIMQCMKVITLRVLNTVRVDSLGQTTPVTKGNSLIITYRVMEYINGLTIDAIKVNGKITKCMVTEFSSGLMEGYTKDNILKIRRKAKEL